MQSENPLIADFVKLVNAAAGTVAGMTREARDGARERLKETIGGLDFVSREEFDAVKAMAARAREENEALKARIDALEAKATGQPKPAAAKPAVAKPRARKPA
jgi:BMFP domain-containing protein YqiC